MYIYKYVYIYIYVYKYQYIYINIYIYVCIHRFIYIYIRRPLPWPRQGRRLGPPEVWNLQAFPSQLKRAFRRELATTLATTLAATCPSQVFFTAFEAAVCPPSNPANPANPAAGFSKATSLAATCYMLQPSISKGVQGCCLPALKPLIHRTATLSNPTTLAAPCPSQVFFTAFEAAVCPPSNPANPAATFPRQQPSQHMPQPCVSKGRSYMPRSHVFYRVQGCRLPAVKPRKPRKPCCMLFQGNKSRSYMLHAPAIYF